MSNNQPQAQHYEVRGADLQTVLTLDGYPCVYDYLAEAEDAADMLDGWVAVLLTDGSYQYL